jgi:hypothetical protein
MRLSAIIRAFILSALACGATGCFADARSKETESRCLPMYRFLIPDEYVGWVRVDFNARDSAALPIEGDYVVFKIPPSGYLRTPARYMCGWPQEYYYYSGDKRRQLDVRQIIRWNGFASGSEPQFEKEMADYIFIGSEAEFIKFGYSNRNAQGVPTYGKLSGASPP